MPTAANSVLKQPVAVGWEEVECECCCPSLQETCRKMLSPASGTWAAAPLCRAHGEGAESRRAGHLPCVTPVLPSANSVLCGMALLGLPRHPSLLAFPPPVLSQKGLRPRGFASPSEDAPGTGACARAQRSHCRPPGAQSTAGQAGQAESAWLFLNWLCCQQHEGLKAEVPMSAEDLALGWSCSPAEIWVLVYWTSCLDAEPVPQAVGQLLASLSSAPAPPYRETYIQQPHPHPLVILTVEKPSWWSCLVHCWHRRCVKLAQS